MMTSENKLLFQAGEGVVPPHYATNFDLTKSVVIQWGKQKTQQSNTPKWPTQR